MANSVCNLDALIGITINDFATKRAGKVVGYWMATEDNQPHLTFQCEDGELYSTTLGFCTVVTKKSKSKSGLR